MILVPLKSQPDLVTLVLNWASPGPSEYAPSGPHVDLVTLVPTRVSSGHGSTAWPAGWPHLDLVIWVPPVRLLWTPSGAHLELVTLILTGPHPDLVTLVLTCGPL